MPSSAPRVAVPLLLVLSVACGDNALQNPMQPDNAAKAAARPGASAAPRPATRGSVTIGVFRPGEPTFALRNANSAGDPDVTVAFGEKGDIPLVGDWDGNGTVTLGV